MQDRRSRLAASVLALVAAMSFWLSLGTVAVLGGDTHRVAALPSIWILIGLAMVAIVTAHLAKLRLEEAWPLLVTLLLWLPFVPFAVPVAFLIWQGPIEGLVWLIAAAGVLAARPPRVVPIVLSPNRAPWIAAAIVALSSLVVFSGIRTVIPGGDEPHYLAATQSILEDFDLRVANNYANGDYLEYFPGHLEPHFLKRSTGGEIYSIHAPGVSIVVLPLFAIGGYVGAVLTMILIAALTAAMVWRLAWRLSDSIAAAWAGVAAVFATTPYFFHTFTIYPEVIGGLCVACGVWLLVELAGGNGASSRSLIAAGAALAVLPWLHSRFAVIAAMLGLVIIARLAVRDRAAAAIARFLAVPIVAGAAWFAFFWVIWGSPSPTAPYGADTSTSSSYIVRGLIGLMIDQQFGLIATAPIYLIALAGFIVLLRQRRRLAVELALVAVPYAIAVASYAMWWAGSAAPARFLVSILPLAALLIAVAFAALPKWRVVFVIVLLVSVGMMVPRAFVESGRFIYNNRSGIDATLQWLSPDVELARALPSVHRDGGTVAMQDAAVWLVVIIGAAWLSALVRRAGSMRWTVAVWLFGIGVMAAATLTWRRHAPTEYFLGQDDSPAIPEDRSALAAVGAYRPSWHRVLVDVSERRPMSRADFLGAMPFRAGRLNRIPAGEYQVKSVTPPTTVAMTIGRNASPIDSPTLDPVFNWRLPVPVQALDVSVVSGVVSEEGGGIWVTPVSVRAPAANRYAIRAARYEHARAFFFDELAYPERAGFWTRADSVAEVVIDTDRDTRLAGLPITVTAGAVDTNVTVTVGAWSESFALAAGQQHDVMLPPAEQRTWRLVIRSGPGFRPSEREPGNRDVRKLAAWIEIH